MGREGGREGGAEPRRERGCRRLPPHPHLPATKEEQGAAGPARRRPGWKRPRSGPSARASWGAAPQTRRRPPSDSEAPGDTSCCYASKSVVIYYSGGRELRVP